MVEKLNTTKNPVFITGFISIILFIIGLILNKYLENQVYFYVILFAVLLGAFTYYLYTIQCPSCKRVFTKNENNNWEEDLGIKKEPYTYYSRKFKYDDGTVENDEDSQKTIMREKKYDRHYYICNKCDYGSNKEWKEVHSVWLGAEPQAKIIKKKGSSLEFGLDLFDDDNYEHEGRRKNIPKSVKKDLWVRNFGKKYKGNCFVCSKIIDTHNFEAGHIKSVFKGGSDNINNLKPICMSCNRSMSSMNLYDFKNKYYKKELKKN